MPDLYFSVGGQLTLQARVTVQSGNESFPTQIVAPGVAQVDLPPGKSVECAVYEPLVQGGHWRSFSMDPENTVVDCPLYQSSAPLGWWHKLHGVNGSNNRGQGIKVGIVDESLPQEVSLPNATNLGSIGLNGKLYPDPHSETLHGLSVAFLVGGRSINQGSFEGIAPGVSLNFVGARSPRNSTKLGTTETAAAIQLLADKKCDLIVVSAGELETEQPNIHNAILDALEAGALCIFAAGNTPGQVLYPARHDEVIAVAAIGKPDVAPAGTLIKVFETYAVEVSRGVFAWHMSPNGREIDCIAAGIGVFDNYLGQPNIDLHGSSFAAPVAAGVLANLLANDPQYLQLPRDYSRAAKARAILGKACQKVGFSVASEGLGLPKC